MIHIMYGLPASGKTTLAMKLFEEYCAKDKKSSYNNKSKITYFNLDINDRKTISNVTSYGIEDYNNYIVIIDGFFKKIEDISKLFWGNFYLRSIDTSVIKIHLFNQDKQACIENDKIRARKNFSINSINEGQEEFNEEIFKKTFFKDREYLFINSKIIIENIKVIDYSIKEDYTIYSPWLVGDNISDEFKELDKWLEEKYPALTFLQYKRICKHIHIEEMNTCDYYEEHNTRSIQKSIKISDIEKELI